MILNCVLVLMKIRFIPSRTSLREVGALSPKTRLKTDPAIPERTNVSPPTRSTSPPGTSHATASCALMKFARHATIMDAFLLSAVCPMSGLEDGMSDSG